MTTAAIPTPVVPLEASTDGKRNTHTSFCAAVGQMMHYSVCLHRLEDHSRSRDYHCSRNIGTSACPAVAMRAQELAKGHAIHFSERQRYVGIAGLVQKARLLVPGAFPGAKVITPAGVAEKPLQGLTADMVFIDEAVEILPDDYMALALTAAAQEKAPVVKGPALAPIKVMPGESMLQAAKRLLAERNSQN